MDKYIGKIIIGRKADYDLFKAKIDEVMSGLKYRIKFETYDDLNTNINLLKEALSSLTKGN